MTTRKSISIIAFVFLIVIGCTQTQESEIEKHMLLGDELIAEGRYEEAIEEFDEIIALDSEGSGWYLMRGNLNISIAMRERGKGATENSVALFNNAIVDFDTALRLDLESTDAYYNRGYSYGRIGNVVLAAADFNRVITEYTETIRLSPNDSVAYRTRAIAYREMGELKLAIDDFNAAIEISPESGTLFAGRAMAHAMLNNDEGATKDVERAIDLGFDKEILLGEIETIQKRRQSFLIEFSIKLISIPVPLATPVCVSGRVRTSPFHHHNSNQTAFENQLNP